MNNALRGLAFCLLTIAVSTLESGPATCRPSNDCADRSISDDCDEACAGVRACPITTFIRPRTITTDLTYRNDMSFYQKYHDARCSFFMFDFTFVYQQNRKGPCIGIAFFGKNPLLFTEEGVSDVNSINLGLSSKLPEGFISAVRFSPKRKVMAWLPVFTFRFDCICPGLWTDMAFAVVHTRHQLCVDEKVATPGDLVVNTTTGMPMTIANVQDAFTLLKVFPDFIRHTGVDDIEIRVGYDHYYKDDDHLGIYILGSIPTGKKFDNARLLQPIVGSQNGSIGAGFSFDNTLWQDEDAGTALHIMSDFKYQFKFKHTDRRMFDLKNGPLSRFLLVVREDSRFLTRSATTLLQKCVMIEPRSTFDWWLAFHYQNCAWGFEAAYNLFWRDRERIQATPFNFGNFGIFDMTRCNKVTSHSTAKISDKFGQGMADSTFTRLTSSDVNLSSGLARKAISHTFSGLVMYNNFWCGYPWSVAFGARYEFAGRNQRQSTFENWGILGKASISV